MRIDGEICLCPGGSVAVFRSTTVVHESTFGIDSSLASQAKSVTRFPNSDSPISESRKRYAASNARSVRKGYDKPLD
jgi:hypothetical protein